MSYEISISRGYRYSDSDFTEITLDEWEGFVSDSLVFEKQEAATAKNPKTGEEIKIRVPNAVRHKEFGFWLTWRAGCISTDYNEELLEEYEKVANSFGAGLFGEEAETIG